MNLNVVQKMMQLLRWALFFAVAMLLILILALTGATGSNMCTSSFTHLTETELRDAAIKVVLNDYPPMVDSVPGSAGPQRSPSRYTPSRYLRYSDPNSFLRENPNCCAIEKMGFGERAVRVEYTFRYFDEAGSKTSTQITRYVYVTSCGETYMD